MADQTARWWCLCRQEESYLCFPKGHSEIESPLHLVCNACGTRYIAFQEVLDALRKPRNLDGDKTDGKST